MSFQGRFRRSTKATLPTWAGIGVTYITETGEIYIGQGPGKPLTQNSGAKYYATFAELPKTGENGKLYLVILDETNRNRATFYVYLDNLTDYHRIDSDDDSIIVGTEELKGNITFKAGENVTLIPDPATNSIIVSAVGGIERGLVGTKLVDEMNIGAGRMLQYDPILNRLVYIDPPSEGESGIGVSLSQLTKIDVTASPTVPKEIDLPISFTTDFKRLPVEILKFISQGENIVTTEVAFDNNDISDFESNNFIEFDGCMHLKKIYDIPVIEETVNDTTKVIKITINQANFQSIQLIEVR